MHCPINRRSSSKTDRPYFRALFKGNESAFNIGVKKDSSSVAFARANFDIL